MTLEQLLGCSDHKPPREDLGGGRYVQCIHEHPLDWGWAAFVPKGPGGGICKGQGGYSLPLSMEDSAGQPSRCTFSYWEEREAGKAQGGNVAVTQSLGVPFVLGERGAYGGRERDVFHESISVFWTRELRFENPGHPQPLFVTF